MATEPRSAAPETLKALFEDAFVRFERLPARIDERGYVEFVERRKNVIVVSGFKA
jgi:hypothetical protein